MGFFLQMSGIIGASSEEVFKALQSFAADQVMDCEPAKGTADDLGIGVIAQQGDNTTVLYPDDFDDWDEASMHLSASLSKPVFSLHIHDGDLWMYLLFDNGDEIDRFNPIPEYWKEGMSEEELDEWKGNAELVAQLAEVASADAIRKYLVRWGLDELGDEKAYPDDEFGIGDCWQVRDFMSKLGLACPQPDEETLPGETFYLGDKRA